jgi:hypothetical protein
MTGAASSARRCAEETAGLSMPGSAILGSGWLPWSLTFVISIRRPASLPAAPPRRPSRLGGPRAPPMPWSAPVTWLRVVFRTPRRGGVGLGIAARDKAVPLSLSARHLVPHRGR